MQVNKHLDLLGKEVEDKVTGVSGVVTSISFDLFGCVQAIVTPKAEANETKSESWFDVTRLEIIVEDGVMKEPNFEKGYVAEGKKGPANKPIP